MKPIRTDRSCTFRSLALSREDIETVIKIFMCAPTSSVAITDGRVEFDSIDEMLGEKGARPRTLEISASTPAIALTLSQASKKLLLYTTAESSEVESAFYRARDFLEGRSRPINYWMAGIMPIVGGFVTIAILVAFTIIRLLPRWLFPWMFAIEASAAFFLVFGRRLDEATFYYVSLEYRPKPRSFWERKRDDLIAGLIVAAIGAVLGIAGTLIIQHLTGRGP